MLFVIEPKNGVTPFIKHVSISIDNYADLKKFLMSSLKKMASIPVRFAFNISTTIMNKESFTVQRKTDFIAFFRINLLDENAKTANEIWTFKNVQKIFLCIAPAFVKAPQATTWSIIQSHPMDQNLGSSGWIWMEKFHLTSIFRILPGWSYVPAGMHDRFRFTTWSSTKKLIQSEKATPE